MITLVLDHLWQSTLFAGGCGLLTLLLAGNAARVRFWVWFAASMKFLVPFAALAWLGARLLPTPQAPLPLFVDLAPTAEPYVMPAANTHALAAITTHPVMAAAPFDWSLFLLVVWAVGSIAITLHWLSRWLKLRTALSGAGPVVSIGGVAVRTAAAPLEPGLFGILRPVILMPQGIEERLSPAELDAVLAHEACHMRHRDNLWAAVHMLVEALFWFHPLVWWLGARLNHERERACDEAVVAAGQAPDIYAESILKVCKLYVASPLACVSGISGAGLKERIERIVVGGLARPLGRLRKLLLTGLAAGSLIVPLSAGILLVARTVDAAPQAQPDFSPAHMAELRAEQAVPRKAIAFNPPDFDKFVGVYEINPGALMTVSRDGSHYLAQLSGQQPVEWFPESPTKFFTNEVRAQISFDGPDGKITELVLHQSGLEQHAPRISADEAKRIQDAKEAHMKSNQPAPGTEDALRRYIMSLEKGAPNYEEMTPMLSAIVHIQLSNTLQEIRTLGQLKSITFKSVNGGGQDVYTVVFENGKVRWMNSPLTADGKTYARGFTVLN